MDMGNIAVAEVIVDDYGVDDLTMDDSVQGVLIRSGQVAVDIYNTGATTEGIYVAFGTSEVDAETNLTLSTDHATTGYWVPPEGDSAVHCRQRFTVPTGATHFAVGNDTASDTQVVRICQLGVTPTPVTHHNPVG